VGRRPDDLVSVFVVSIRKVAVDVAQAGVIMFVGVRLSGRIIRTVFV
jgi:hypothetical protein